MTTASLSNRIAALEATAPPKLAQWDGRAALAAALASRPDGVEMGEHLAALIADIEAGIPGAPIDLSGATTEQLRVLASLRLAADLDRRT